MTTQTYTRGQVLTADALNAVIASFSAFSGGTVPNPTTFAGTATGSIVLAPLSNTGALIGDTAQLLSQYNVYGGGGTAGQVVSNIRAYSSIYGAPNAYIWSILGVVDYNGTGGTGQHVGVYGQANRRVANAGGAAANPQLWGMTIGVNDFTASASSATNASLGLEIDMAFNGLDDANNRSGLIMAVVRRNPSGAAAQVNVGLGFTSGTITDSFKSVISIGATYSAAGIDLRTGTKTGGHSLWMGDTHDIAMDNAGINTIYYDPTALAAAGAIRFGGNIQMDGAQVYLPNAAMTLGGALFIGASRGLRFSTQASGAAAQTATLTNAPAAGNPGFWLPVTINGVSYQIPAWAG